MLTQTAFSQCWLLKLFSKYGQSYIEKYAQHNNQEEIFPNLWNKETTKFISEWWGGDYLFIF